MSETLADALPREIQRVRDIIVEYRNPLLKGAGDFAANLMEADVKKSLHAIMQGDVVEMLRLYSKLQEWKL